MKFDKIFTLDYLTEHYINQEKSKAQIARENNTSTHIVYKWLEKHNLPNDLNRTYKHEIEDLSKTIVRTGRLNIKERVENDKFGKVKWLCECDCGNKVIINAASLKRKLSNSCGCLKKEIARKGSYEDISVHYWNNIIKQAEERNIEFNITPEIIWNMYLKQDKKCSLSDLEIKFGHDSNKPEDTTASVDRIDSTKGYLVDNIQIVHKIVNQMKNFFTQEEFIIFCNLISFKHKVDHETCKERITRKLIKKI